MADHPALENYIRQGIERLERFLATAAECYGKGRRHNDAD